MDLRQLNALLAVASTGSFSAAARSLDTVQSNVSTHIARLEQELGTTLIDRGTGQLTDEGEIVASRARRVNAELEAVVDDLASMHDHVTGTARVGVIGTTARWLVPRLLVTMAERHPGVRVIVTDATTSSLLLQLSSGALDFAVVNLPTDDPEISTRPLFDEDALIVVPNGHPLHDLDTAPLSTIDGVPLLVEPRGTAFRDHVDAQCQRAGITLVPQAEVDGMRLLATLAFEGFGAALLPASAAPVWASGDWKALPVPELASRTVGLASRRRGQLAAPARALLAAITDIVEADGNDQPGIHPSSDDDQGGDDGA